MKKITLLFITISLFFTSCSSDDNMNTMNPISGTRYNAIVFDSTQINETKNVIYGSNITQAGRNVDLSMNIFEPANDTEQKRPLIVLAHGGGFTEGDKEDFNPLALYFAQSGYVAATISYRFLEGEGSLQKAVVDAVHDMKAAVRFFTKDNTYNIDPDNIFVGGFSAGAVMALHYAYLDEGDLATGTFTEIQEHLSASGGLSGTSGNPDASEKVKGVISISGGLFKANWVDAGEPILYSIHGDNDSDVTCTIDPESQTNPNGDFTEGPCLIHPLLDELGVRNKFNQIQGGDHGVYFTCTTCDDDMRQFIFESL